MDSSDEDVLLRTNEPDNQEILKILMDNQSIRMKILLKHKSKFNLSMKNEQEYVLNYIHKTSVEKTFKSKIKALQTDIKDSDAIVWFTSFIDSIAEEFIREKSKNSDKYQGICITECERPIGTDS